METIIAVIVFCAIILWAIVAADKNKHQHLSNEHDSREEDLEEQRLTALDSDTEVQLIKYRMLRESTECLKSIKRNMQFFVWITIISIFISILILLPTITK